MQLALQQFGNVINALRKTGESSGSEKRRHNRIEIQAQVKMAALAGGKIVRFYTSLTQDLSVAGIGLFQYSAMESGEEFLVRLPTTAEEEAESDLLVTCRTTFCRPVAEGLFKLGAGFISIADAKMLAALEAREQDQLARIQKSIMGS